MMLCGSLGRNPENDRPAVPRDGGGGGLGLANSHWATRDDKFPAGVGVQ